MDLLFIEEVCHYTGKLRGNKMDWMKKHSDTLAVIAIMFSGFLWMNGKFNALEKDMAVMKTVLIMKEIMPIDLAVNMENK